MEKANKIVFKVVHINMRKQFVSTNCNGADISMTRSMRLKYKLGEVTVPKIGKIFCFEDRIQAENWMYSMGGKEYYRVLKGVAENVTRATFLTVLHSSQHNLGSLRNFWADPNNQAMGWNTPRGSFVCDSFKPTEVL